VVSRLNADDGVGDTGARLSIDATRQTAESNVAAPREQAEHASQIGFVIGLPRMRRPTATVVSPARTISSGSRRTPAPFAMAMRSA